MPGTQISGTEETGSQEANGREQEPIGQAVVASWSQVRVWAPKETVTTRDALKWER